MIVDFDNRRQQQQQFRNNLLLLVTPSYLAYNVQNVLSFLICFFLICFLSLMDTRDQFLKFLKFGELILLEVVKLSCVKILKKKPKSSP